jgi:hypothetical protein
MSAHRQASPRDRSTRRVSFLCTAMAAALGLAVGGCSMDDVELNGGIFNAMGINNAQSKSAEPKLAERTPLVVPPTTQKLPQPGVPLEAQAVDVTASINDPDRMAEVNQEELQRQQDEYCQKNYELAKAHGDNNADLVTGPLGPCRNSVLSAVKKWNQGEAAE